MSRSFNFRALRGEFKTTVVTDELALEESLRLLLSKVNGKLHGRGKVPERVVALDIEKSFCSASYGMVKERVVVLMLGVENDCLIIHLTHFEKLPTSLSKFLDLSDITFVGVSIKSNLADLQRDYGIQCRNGVDLGVFAAAVRDSTGISAYPLPCIVRCSNIDFCKPDRRNFKASFSNKLLAVNYDEHINLSDSSCTFSSLRQNC